MPALSQNQRIAAAIAEHSPSSLFKRNAGMLGMSQGQLHDFASTSEKGLPKKVKVKPLGKISIARLMKRKPAIDNAAGEA